MTFIEFLLEYYVYILVVLIILIVGIIGFLVDSKNNNEEKHSKKNKKDTSEEFALEGQQQNVVSEGVAGMAQQESGTSVVSSVEEAGTMATDFNSMIASSETMVSQGQSMIENSELHQTVMPKNVSGSSMVSDALVDLSEAVMPVQNDAMATANLQMEEMTGSNNAVVQNDLSTMINVPESVATVVSVVQQQEVGMQQPIVPETSMPIADGIVQSQSQIPVQPETMANSMAASSTIESQASIPVIQPIMEQNVISTQGANSSSSVFPTVEPVASSTVSSVISSNVVGEQPTMVNPLIQEIPRQELVSAETSFGESNVGVIPSDVSTVTGNQVISNENQPVMGNTTILTTDGSQPFDISSMFGNNQ